MACTFSTPGRHLEVQKWSEPRVFCTCLLPKVLRATTACTVSTSQLPKVLRTWGVLCILNSKCASGHNGVQFFIFHLASWLRTRRFSEPTFSTLQSHKKTQCFATFLPFRPPASSLQTFSLSDLLPSDFLHVRVSSWLCFFLAVLFICPYCRKFTSKLPSTSSTSTTLKHNYCKTR